MDRKHWMIGLSLCAMLGLSASPAAAETDQRIAELESRIAELEDKKHENWLNERRAEEVKALVREVLQDAESRASLLEGHGGGMFAGHDGHHFFLKSADGGFLLNIGGQIQFRYLGSFRDGQRTVAPVGTHDDNGETGFDLGRVKLKFFGHIADPRIKYLVRLEVEHETNNVVADEVVLGYQVNDALMIWGGEAKAPLMREEMIEAYHLLAVDRTFVNETLTTGIVQGVGLVWQDHNVFNDSLRVQLMVNDGARGAEAEFESIEFSQPHHTSPIKDFHEDFSDVAFTGRVDIRLAGDWGKLQEFTSWPGEELSAFVGAAIHQEFGETGDGDDNNNFTIWTVDGSVQSGGLSLYGAVVGLNTDNVSGSTDYEAYGVIVQGAYNMPVGDDSIEPFVRYEHMDFDGFATDHGHADNTVGFITAGANYYLAKHAAKFTVDVTWALDPVPFKHSKLGLLADAGSEDGQVVLRGQFQLLF